MQITVRYDEILQEITGVAEEPVVMGGGTTFPFILHSIFSSYPEIMERYPPGTIGIFLNDAPPEASTILLDGDVVSFFAIPQ